MSKTWGFLFGGSGHGPESSCHISAYYKFFPGKSYFYRTKTRNQVLLAEGTEPYAGIFVSKSGEGLRLQSLVGFKKAHKYTPF